MTLKSLVEEHLQNNLLHSGRLLYILSGTVCRKEKFPDEDDFSLGAKTLHQGNPVMKILHDYSLDDKTHPEYFY